MIAGTDGRAATDPSPFAGPELLEVLETLAAQEGKITEAIYPLFFERRPDARPLFGVHALAEREEMIRETSTEESPWYVVPADNKWYTRLVVGAAVIDALGGLKLKYPELDEAKVKELRAARTALTKG